MMGTMDVMPLSTSEVEVMAKRTRRQYRAEYRLRILLEADASTGPGTIGTLLRREELYSSNLTAWRNQREKGEAGVYHRSDVGLYPGGTTPCLLRSGRWRWRLPGQVRVMERLGNLAESIIVHLENSTT